RRYYDPDRLDVLSQLTWPVIGYTSISSPFGPRIHPIKKVSSFHYGIDIPAPHGRPVKAILPGTVTSSGWMGGYGNTVILDHGDGLVSLYAHLSKISVRSGDHVAGNTEIGQIGTTGLSTGNHLHFEIRINGSYTDPVAHYKLKEMNIRAEQGAGGEENY
ncbi:MAG: M23 family metallopeptidase, partial [Bacillales bacterium]|nr:M23 family metallopeptidase [Bacillales bacterium]